MDWVRMLAYISGTVDQELLLRNEYLVAENRILKAQLKTPLRLTDAERMTLAEITYRLGRKALIYDEIEHVVVRMAKENSDWGYDRIVGATATLGYTLSDQTVGNILQRHGVPPASERKRATTWADFIRAHLAVRVGTDFSTVEVLTLRGLVTYGALASFDWYQDAYPDDGGDPYQYLTWALALFRGGGRQEACNKRQQTML